MRRLRAWLLRLAGVFGAGRPNREIAEELQSHRDLLVAEYERSGVTADDARRRAVATLGSLSTAANAYQERRTLPGLEAAIRDGRMALRSLIRTPVLSASMALVLGLGIGISTAALAVLHAIVWAELPVPAPQDVVRVAQRFDGTVDRRLQGQPSWFSYPEIETYRQATSALAAVAGVSYERVTWRTDAEMRRIPAALVTGDYFRVLPVTPVLGRTLSPLDARARVVVIAYSLWVGGFGSDAGVIGQQMWLDRSAYSIVGVAPRSFSGTEVEAVSVWVPLEAAHVARADHAVLTEGNMSWLQVLGRLAPGSSLPAATAEAAGIAARFDGDHPGRRTTIAVNTASRLDVSSLQQSKDRGPLMTGAAVGAGLLWVLLLICGSNAAALLLARGAARHKEIAVRLAIGAGRSHIVRQLAAEIAVIAIASAGVGLAVCFGSLQALAGLLPIPELLLGIEPDVRVFMFAFLAAAAVATLFGLAPARQALRVDCLAGLKGDGMMFGERVPAIRLRRALIAIQVAVSLVLLVAASLLGRGVSQSGRVNPGYRTHGLYFVQPDPPRSGRDFAEAVAALPGIRGVGQAMLAPFFGYGISTASTGAVDGPDQRVNFNQIDGRYFAALGVPLLTGRSFLPEEHDAVIVNAALARRLWPADPSVVGHVILVPPRKEKDTARVPMRIVGVTPTLQTNDIGIPDPPTYYTLLTDEDARTAALVVRTDDNVQLPQLALNVVRSSDAEAYVRVMAIDARLVALAAPARIGAVVAGLIGLLALAVAAVGIHGVVAYAVLCRTRDIGIHQALGARPGQVLWLILEWTLRGVAAGVFSAVLLLLVAGAAFATPLRAMLNGLNPLDPVSLMTGVIGLVVVVALAAYLPARRALGLAPLAALRYD